MTKKWTATRSGVQPKRLASKKTRQDGMQRLLRDLRVYVADERDSVIYNGCYGDVIAAYEKRGVLPKPKDVDHDQHTSPLRRAYRRQSRLIARIDEEGR